MNVTAGGPLMLIRLWCYLRIEIDRLKFSTCTKSSFVFQRDVTQRFLEEKKAEVETKYSPSDSIKGPHSDKVPAPSKIKEGLKDIF